MSVASELSDLDDNVPAGTRYVIEGADAGDGQVFIVARYLLWPDGRRTDLLSTGPRLFECGCAKARARRQRKPQVDRAPEFA